MNFGFMNRRSNCLELKCISSGRRCSSRSSDSSLASFDFLPFLPFSGLAPRPFLVVEGMVMAVFEVANKSLADGGSEFSKSIRNGVFSLRVCLVIVAFSAGSAIKIVRFQTSKRTPCTAAYLPRLTARLSFQCSGPAQFLRNPWSK